MDERKDNPFQEEPVNEAIPMEPANNEGKASEADAADTAQPVAAGADAAQPANPYGAPLQSGVPVNAGAQPVNPYATPVAQPATEAAQPAAQPAAEGGAQPAADAGAAPAADPTQPVPARSGRRSHAAGESVRCAGSAPAAYDAHGRPRSPAARQPLRRSRSASDGRAAGCSRRWLRRTCSAG